MLSLKSNTDKEAQVRLEYLQQRQAVAAKRLHACFMQRSSHFSNLSNVSIGIYVSGSSATGVQLFITSDKK